MQELLKGKNFSEFEKYNEKHLNQINDVLHKDLPQLLKSIQPPKEAVEKDLNPFSAEQWIIDDHLFSTYSEIFQSLNPLAGSLGANAARDALLKTGIPVESLKKIWELSDFEKNGKLDEEEFALALFLSEEVKQGRGVPDHLPPTFIPPSKRSKFPAVSPKPTSRR